MGGKYLLTSLSTCTVQCVAPAYCYTTYYTFPSQGRGHTAKGQRAAKERVKGSPAPNLRAAPKYAGTHKFKLQVPTTPVSPLNTLISSLYTEGDF